MTLKDQITEDMKTAMRAKDSERLAVFMSSVIWSLRDIAFSWWIKDKRKNKLHKKSPPERPRASFFGPWKAVLFQYIFLGSCMARIRL